MVRHAVEADHQFDIENDTVMTHGKNSGARLMNETRILENDVINLHSEKHLAFRILRGQIIRGKSHQSTTKPYQRTDFRGLNTQHGMNLRRASSEMLACSAVTK